MTRESYRQGATDYLNVLTALLSQQSLEQQLIDARRQVLSNRVQLCRALGYPTGIDLDSLIAGSFSAAVQAADAGSLVEATSTSSSQLHQR